MIVLSKIAFSSLQLIILLPLRSVLVKLHPVNIPSLILVFLKTKSDKSSFTKETLAATKIVIALDAAIKCRLFLEFFVIFIHSFKDF